MKLTFLFAFFVAFLAGVDAWAFTAMTKNNFKGKRRTFYSATGKTDCYNIPDDVAGNVHSLVYCTMPWTRCSITLHSKSKCEGSIVGSSSRTWPKIWEDRSVSGKTSKVRSFRIQGCKKVGTTLDITKCYNSKNPWE
ncbi:hypothetical protein jhhlp_006993 [Lomentospora prolificans]|uniref:Secreted protein n=1 Tax=Lomentospora prolificans TaxID=41688 RepID=A0A2N3N1E4_9PEZI|nr:hypothetical protein jhhlp_006993 [Lomentospora prolificans]